MSRDIRSRVVEAVLLSTLVGSVFLLAQWHYGLTGILGLGDEGLLWYLSQRTALGELPIRDYFSYDPGRYYWSAFIFKLLRGNGLFEQIVADDLFGIIGLFAAYVVMCRSAISRSWRIAILLLLGVSLGFPRHKIYEQTLSLIAVAGVTFVLADGSNFKRWFYYGVATGLAAFIGRNSGVYFVIAALLALAMLRFLGEEVPPARVLGTYVTGITIGYLPMFAMIVCFHGFALALWQSILFTSKWQIPLPVPFPWRLHALGLYGLQPIAMSILYIIAPLMYAVFLLPIALGGPKADFSGARRLVYGASMAGVPYLHHAFGRAEFGHLAQAVLPLLVASGAFCQYLYDGGRRYVSLVCFFGLTGLVLTCWLPREPSIQYLRAPGHFEKIEIQTKEFEVPRPDAELMLAAKTTFRRCGSVDGSFLAVPWYPGLYAFLNVRAPFRDLYLLSPRSEDFQNQHIEALIRNRTAVVLLNRTVGGERQLANTYPKLLEYILTHYRRIDMALPKGAEMYDMPQQCRNSSEPAK